MTQGARCEGGPYPHTCRSVSPRNSALPVRRINRTLVPVAERPNACACKAFDRRFESGQVLHGGYSLLVKRWAVDPEKPVRSWLVTPMTTEGRWKRTSHGDPHRERPKRKSASLGRVGCHQYLPVAQWLEHQTDNLGVGSSILPRETVIQGYRVTLNTLETNSRFSFKCGSSSVARTPACQVGGHGFKSHLPLHAGRMVSVTFVHYKSSSMR